MHEATSCAREASKRRRRLWNWQRLVSASARWKACGEGPGGAGSKSSSEGFSSEALPGHRTQQPAEQGQHSPPAGPSLAQARRVECKGCH